MIAALTVTGNMLKQCTPPFLPLCAPLWARGCIIATFFALSETSAEAVVTTCVCWCLFRKFLPQLTPCQLLCAPPWPPCTSTFSRFDCQLWLFSRLKEQWSCVKPNSCVTYDMTLRCPAHAVRGNPSVVWLASCAQHACPWQQSAFDFLCCCFHLLLHNQLFFYFKETQLRGSTQPAFSLSVCLPSLGYAVSSLAMFSHDACKSSFMYLATLAAWL